VARLTFRASAPMFSFETISRVGGREARRRGVERILLGVTLVSCLALYAADRSGSTPSGDGFYSWIYARSLAFDGDLEFSNDYALCGDPFHLGTDRGGGRPDNPFYFGPALAWTPVLLFWRLVTPRVWLPTLEEQAGCVGLLPRLTLLLSPAAATLTAWFSFRVARRWVTDEVAAIAAAAFALGTPLLGYATTVSSYSHVYAACAVAGLLHASFRGGEDPRRATRWIAVAVFLAVAIMNRLSETLYALVPLAFAAQPGLDFRARRTALISVAAGCLAGIGCTGALYHAFYGTPFTVPQGPQFLHLGRAHPWLVLFGVHGGFFFWAPIAWLSVAGWCLVAFDSSRRRFWIAATLCMVAEIWISSAALDWDASWSLGARRLLPMTAFLVLFGAVALQRICKVLRAVVSPRTLFVALAMGWLLIDNVAAMTSRGDVPYTQAELYAGGSRLFWSGMDRVGDLAILPAEWFFHFRYGLPISSYRAALTPRYVLDLRTSEWTDSKLSFADPDLQPVLEGITRTTQGDASFRGRARMVFSAQWPFATRITLRARTDAPTVVVMRRRFLASQWVAATFALSEGTNMRSYTAEIAADALDSGLLEYTFETSPPEAVVSVESIGFEDTSVQPEARRSKAFSPKNAAR
jgi:hypothetical protein